MKKNSIVKVVLLLIVSGVLAACQTKAQNLNPNERTVKIAYVQGSKPVTYTDESGEAAGYDVDVLREVAKRLPNYKFEFVGTSDDDLLIGVEQGKYQVGVKNAFFTEERTKKFIYPKEYIGLSSTGFVLKKKYADIQSLADFAEKDLSLAPIAANNAQYAVIQQFNDEHPEKPINLKAGDTFSIDVVQWVNEERVDGAVIIGASYDRQITDSNGPYHHLKDEVVYNEFAVIETWPLFNKKEQQFADDFDRALKEVKEEGILSELSIKHYGRDLFELVNDQ